MAAAPIATLDRDQRRVVAEAFRDPPTTLFGPVRRWQFVLLLLGERPACRLISTRDLASHRDIAALRTRPDEVARGEFLGQLLRECGLPFFVRVPPAATGDTSTLHTVYYVAVTAERFELLPDPVSVPSDERVANWMNRPRALGRFLGYPADAIDAYEANACSGNREWTDPLPEPELDRRVRPLVDQLYEEPPLPSAAILDAVLPYTPPLPSFDTSRDHLDRAVRYLEAGVQAERFGRRALKDRLGDYRRHL